MAKIVSKCMYNTYKTMAAYKTAKTKYLKSLKTHLDMLDEHYNNGWDLYLGDPIYPQIRETRREIRELKAEEPEIIKEEYV